MSEKLTGYPSIDKPWLKYYSEDILSVTIPEMTMYELLYESNRNRLENVAIRYYGNDITYGKLFERIKITAAALLSYGIDSGDVVTILSLNTPETTYVIYALNYIGAVANLLVANTPVQEINSNLKETNTKLFVVLDRMLDGLGEIECSIPIVTLAVGDSARGVAGVLFNIGGSRKRRYISYKEFVKNQKPHDQYLKFSCHNPAIIVYTSGTTGVPKGVVLSNYNLNSCAIQCSVSGKNYQENEKFLNILPPFFSFGIGMKHLCLYAGMIEIPTLIPKVDIVIKMIKKHKPTRFVMGPAFIDVIVQYSDKDMSFLVDLTGGGGSISAETENLLNKILQEKKAKSKYLSGYGMTELSAAVSMNHNDKYKEQSIGIPLPLTNVKICDLQNGEELGYGGEGELLVSSPGMMLGYFNNTEETEKVIQKSKDGTKWMCTGDLAKIDEDGFVFVTGRLKRIYIVTDGEVVYKLFPQRMEDMIEQLDGVLKSGVVVLEDVKQGYIPVVFVSVDSSMLTTSIKENVIKEIENNLPAYYKPKEIFILDEMPINSNQKIDYRTLEIEARNRFGQRKED